LSKTNDPKSGNNALILGVISTIVLFGLGYFLPDSIMDKIPQAILPIIYIAIIQLIIDKTQGHVLKKHKENENSFFSAWRAAGIGILSLIAICAVMLIPIFLSSDYQFEQRYNKDLSRFTDNEVRAMEIYDKFDTDSRESLISQINSRVIPAWKDNIAIAKALNELESVPASAKAQVALLLDYANLRLKASKLMKRSIQEDSNLYDLRLNNYHDQLDDMVNEINALHGQSD